MWNCHGIPIRDPAYRYIVAVSVRCGRFDTKPPRKVLKSSPWASQLLPIFLILQQPHSLESLEQVLGRHVTGFKWGDAKAAEAVETLLLDTEFFKGRVKEAAKDLRLLRKRWSFSEKSLWRLCDVAMNAQTRPETSHRFHLRRGHGVPRDT
jgi:hypothetical protein